MPVVGIFLETAPHMRGTVTRDEPIEHCRRWCGVGVASVSHRERLEGEE